MSTGIMKLVRNIVFLLTLMTFAIGCGAGRCCAIFATPDDISTNYDVVEINDLRSKNTSNSAKLKVGMDKREVLSIMGTETILAREGAPHGCMCLSIFGIKTYKKPHQLSNPYRVETKRVGYKNFLIIYYLYTDTEKDLPLVFEDNKLVGWGRNFYNEMFEKHKTKMNDR